MNLAAAAAALALVAAAPLSALGRATGRRALDLASRGLAAVAGVLLLFAVARPAARPAAVLAFAAVVVAPRGLPCLLSAAAAVVAAVRPAPPAGSGFAVWPLVAALALALAASALQEVLGLALLFSLAGSLSMAVHALSVSTHGSRAGLIGQRLLVLGAGLGGLGVAVAASQGLGRSAQSLAAGALDLAAMLLAVGVLILALIRRLAVPAPPGGAFAGAVAEPGGERTLHLAAAAALLAAAAAGFEGWRSEGTYATTTVAEAASGALLGLVAVQPTRLGLLRAALFVIGLLGLLARAS